MIGIDGERESGDSMLSAQFDEEYFIYNCVQNPL